MQMLHHRATYQLTLVDHRCNDIFRTAENVTVKVVSGEFASRHCCIRYHGYLWRWWGWYALAQRTEVETEASQIAYGQ